MLCLRSYWLVRPCFRFDALSSNISSEHLWNSVNSNLSAFDLFLYFPFNKSPSILIHADGWRRWLVKWSGLERAEWETNVCGQRGQEKERIKGGRRSIDDNGWMYGWMGKWKDEHGRMAVTSKDWIGLYGWKNYLYRNRTLDIHFSGRKGQPTI